MSSEPQCTEIWANSPLDQADAFQRKDETDDAIFYGRDRFVSHLDSLALKTVERVIGTLLVENRPAILDLMAGWDSHIPDSIEPGEVVGLGLNGAELAANRALDRRIIHDLNQDPVLPFPDQVFDVVLNTVSVDYLTRPLRVFSEVARVLKPGGLHLVIFSNRMFPDKVVKVWNDASEDERVLLVEEYFARAGGYDAPQTFVSQNKPRPADDKYAGRGIPSDPIFAVFAETSAIGKDRLPRPVLDLDLFNRPDAETLRQRKAVVGQTLKCPHCEQPLSKWAVPDNPFCQTWDNDFMYICFNDSCTYYLDGWDTLAGQGVSRTSYRLMYDPIRDVCRPVPVPTHRALRDGILEE